MAQVTVYGTLDAAVANTTGEGTQFMGEGGWVAGNTIGFKGSEDLGNGLKADFNLRAGISLARGTSDNGGNGTLFNQLANVGLSGDFGSISLGQQFSPFIGAIAGGTAGNGNFFVNRILMGTEGNASGAATGAQSAGGFFIANAISYTTPSINGFTVTALTNARNGGPNTRGTDDAAGSLVATAADRYDTAVLSGDIAGGKVSLGLEQRSTYKTQLLAASIPVGDLTLSGTALSFTPTGGDANMSYSVSGAYLLTSGLTGSLQYASGESAAGAKQSLTGLGLNYALSKATAAYFSYTLGTGGLSSSYSYRGSSTMADRNNTTAVGLIHNF